MDTGTRVKVIHVVTRLDFGGAQQNTLYTCRHLDSSRFDCVLASGPGGTLAPELAASLGQARRVIVPSLGREISLGRDLLALLQLVNLFLSERPDVVHTHSSKAGILGHLAAAAVGVPVVMHTYHGFGFNEFQPPRVKRLYVWLERLCARLSTAIVFVSRANQDYARRHGIGDPARWRLLHSGVALSRYPARVEDRGRKKAQLGLGLHKPVVTTIGNLKPQKNPGDFLAMAQKVLARRPETEFYFVGDGPLRGRIECQAIAAGLSNRLRLPGWRMDVDEILAVSDVFVLTSLWEGLPRALVEAMKTGLPCVCYATDGVTDIVSDGVNGFCVPQGNVSELASRVLALLDDESLRRRLGEQAARSIGPEFDIDEMVRAQERLYGELLAAV